METTAKPRRRADNVVRFSMNIENLMKMWMSLLRPFHKLKQREQDLASALLAKRYYISKGVTDNNVIDGVLLSKSIKNDIREELGMSMQFFQVCMTSLRKAKFIVDNKVNLRFVPSITDPKCFELMFHFDIQQDESDKSGEGDS